MSRIVLRTCLALALSLFLPATLLAQSKEAQEKYQKALKELDWKKSGRGFGYSNPNDPRLAPPNPEKAEKYFNEAIALAPEWALPVYGLGDLHFVMKKYSAASTAYGKARDLDDKKRQLDKDQRHDLLDQLGLSFALARKYKEAHAVYTAAVKEDPEFPLFHYNLACVYAETQDIENAITHLKLAWQYRENLPAGVEFPDPRKDSSFSEYLNDPAFKEAVEAMVI